MCGIIARIGDDDSVENLLTGLENLEYRGYDSAGVAVQNGEGIKIHKRSGRVDDLREEVETARPAGSAGIGHTRWSTHGPPTDENAHPHTSQTSSVAVVHNGVIENYSDLRAELKDRGRTFTSDTDTEVVPHLIDEYLEDGEDHEAAFRSAIRDLEGSYAIAALIESEDTVYAARQGSPLVLGRGNDGYYLASDVPAFLEYTDRVTYLEDGDVAILDESEVSLSTLDGAPVDRDVERVDWDPEETGKGRYDHFMLKEINTQPSSLSNTIEGRTDPAAGDVTLEDFEDGTFADVDRVHLVACGTSYHAAMFGTQLLRSANVHAEAFRANEYDVAAGPVDENTLVLAVTQSGETADTLSAVRTADEEGATTAAVTNVVGSTVAREVDHPLFIRAGPEIGVAATKTFSSQAVSLALLGQHIAADIPRGEPRDDLREFLTTLESLPGDIQHVLDGSSARRIAEQFQDSESYFFIGRGLANAVAKEGSLKFKEITYEHAEGFASGELKHGPLALVTPNTPVFAVFTGDSEQDTKTLKNAEEAQARGAPIVAVAPPNHPAEDVADEHLEVPESHPAWTCLLANVQLQLVSYHAAELLSRPIDKPRNLAKSVTVE